MPTSFAGLDGIASGLTHYVRLLLLRTRIDEFNNLSYGWGSREKQPRFNFGFVRVHAGLASHVDAMFSLLQAWSRTRLIVADKFTRATERF